MRPAKGACSFNEGEDEVKVENRSHEILNLSLNLNLGALACESIQTNSV